MSTTWASVMTYRKRLTPPEPTKTLKGWCDLRGAFRPRMTLPTAMHSVRLNSGDPIPQAELISMLGCLICLRTRTILVTGCLSMLLLMVGVVMGVGGGVLLGCVMSQFPTPPLTPTVTGGSWRGSWCVVCSVAE